MARSTPEPIAEWHPELNVPESVLAAAAPGKGCERSSAHDGRGGLQEEPDPAGSSVSNALSLRLQRSIDRHGTRRARTKFSLVHLDRGLTESRCPIGRFNASRFADNWPTAGGPGQRCSSGRKPKRADSSEPDSSAALRTSGTTSHSRNGRLMRRDRRGGHSRSAPGSSAPSGCSRRDQRSSVTGCAESVRRLLRQRRIHGAR